MDLLFIIRDALGSSAVGTLATAVEAQQGGRRVAVLFTQDALAALAGGSFEWSRTLSGPRTRMALADAGKRAGLPTFARGDARQLDPKATVAWAKDAGVTLYACPFWSELLAIEGELLEGLEAIDKDATISLLADAGQVVGSL